MDNEKTLLQQIREKEQELGHRVDLVQKEAEAIVEAAKTEAGDLLCTTDKAVKVTAEQVYWKERGRTETEINELRRGADLVGETAALQEQGNVPAAIERIIRYAIME